MTRWVFLPYFLQRNNLHSSLQPKGRTEFFISIVRPMAGPSFPALPPSRPSPHATEETGLDERGIHAMKVLEELNVEAILSLLGPQGGPKRGAGEGGIPSVTPSEPLISMQFIFFFERLIFPLKTLSPAPRCIQRPRSNENCPWLPSFCWSARNQIKVSKLVKIGLLA